MFSRAERQRKPNVGFARGAARNQDKEESPEPNIRELFRQLRSGLQASMRDLKNKLFMIIYVSNNEAQMSPKGSGDWVRPYVFRTSGTTLGNVVSESKIVLRKTDKVRKMNKERSKLN